MILQPKTAINFRSDEERKVIQMVAEKQGIRNAGNLKNMRKGRAYICPENYRGNGSLHIEQWDEPDEECSADKDDPFEWTYVEASSLLRNLIIAERRKNAT